MLQMSVIELRDFMYLKALEPEELAGITLRSAPWTQNPECCSFKHPCNGKPNSNRFAHLQPALL